MSSSSVRPSLPLRRRLGRLRLPAVLVLVASLALTSVAWVFAEGYTAEHARVGFELDADELETLVAERMVAYEEILLAGRGFFVADGDVTREEWRTFVEELDLERTYPGIQGVGFSVLILPEELEAHVATVRAEGFPNYNVTPPGERDVYTSILYLEPFERRNLRAFGYDMFSDPVRRQAMEVARDTGQPALSGSVRLVQENETDIQTGFLLYVPLYRQGWPRETVEERRAALLGWVYSPFRSADLMTAILRERNPALGVELYDGRARDPDTLLYDSAPESPPGELPDGPSRVRTITVANREWTLVTHPLAGSVAPYEKWIPRGVLAAGLVTSLLLFAIVWSLNSTRERSILLAEEMTAELRRSRDELQATNDALEAFTYVVSHDLKEPVRGVEAYLRILREDHANTLDPEARHLTERAHAETLRMSALLTSLLELSRVNRAELTMRRVRVGDVLASPDCRLAYERRQEEAGAQVLVDCPTPVLVTPPVLSQALGNLVANALTHGGEGVTKVHVREVARDGALVEIVVEDDGVGFPPAFVSRFNVGGADTGTSGFGLLIARRAVERLGGTLWLGRSEALGGGAVHFTLTAAPEDARA